MEGMVNENKLQTLRKRGYARRQGGRCLASGHAFPSV